MNTILHHTSSVLTFDSLYVIESLDVNDGDTLTGTNLFNNLKPYTEMAKAISPFLISVETAEQ